MHCVVTQIVTVGQKKLFQIQKTFSLHSINLNRHNNLHESNLYRYKNKSNKFPEKRSIQ